MGACRDGARACAESHRVDCLPFDEKLFPLGSSLHGIIGVKNPVPKQSKHEENERFRIKTYYVRSRALVRLELLLLLSGHIPYTVRLGNASLDPHRPSVNVPDANFLPSSDIQCAYKCTFIRSRAAAARFLPQRIHKHLSIFFKYLVFCFLILFCCCF